MLRVENVKVYDLKESVMRIGSKKPTTLAVGGIEPRSFFV